MFAFKNRAPNKRVIYKTVNGINLPMDIYLPDGGADKNTKCIVAIHGGGWEEAIRDNSEWDGGRMRFQVRYYADQGYVGIAFSYRSLSAHDGMTVRDILNDCTDAMRYIQENIEYIDHEHMILIGDSAGGHIATMLGIAQDDTIRPYGVVACNPVLDCLNERWKYGFAGCETIADYSPYQQTPKKCAKFLFVHGTDDQVVDFADTETFAHKLSNLGHTSELLKLDGTGHAFILYDYMNDDAYVTDIMQKIDEWIEDNVACDGNVER